jgi:hypothetical protein
MGSMSMRSAVGIFGAICGLIVIALVGRYGYMSTDVEADAYIVAFVFGAVAAGGLFGPQSSPRRGRDPHPAGAADDHRRQPNRGTDVSREREGGPVLNRRLR